MSKVATNNEESTKLTIQIPKNLHAYIKSQSALQHVSIKDFIVSAIMKNTESGDYECEHGYFHNYSQNSKLLEELKKSEQEHKTGKNKNFKTFANVKDLMADLNSNENDEN